MADAPEPDGPGAATPSAEASPSDVPDPAPGGAPTSAEAGPGDAPASNRLVETVTASVPTPTPIPEVALPPLDESALPPVGEAAPSGTPATPTAAPPISVPVVGAVDTPPPAVGPAPEPTPTPEPAAPVAEAPPPTPEPAAPVVEAPVPPPSQPAAPAPPPPPEDDPPPGEAGAPAWMMTFGDMMSLLLTFFILMYSMSSMEAEKFKVTAASIREAFGNSEGQSLPDDAAPAMSDTIPIYQSLGDEMSDAALDIIESQLQDFVKENELEEQVEVEKDNSGVHLRIKDAALFGPGSANIEQESVAIVDKLGDMLRSIDVPIVVAGHTDNVPIRSPVFRSNWELSAARAAGVARIFVSRGHLPETLTVEAYGEYRPLAENDTPEGRSENRRVEIYYAKEAVKTVLRERGVLRDGNEDAADDPAGVGDGIDGAVEGASVGTPDPPAGGGEAGAAAG